MRRTIMILCGIACVAVQGQDAATVRSFAGVKTGINLCTLDPENGDNLNGTGFMLGFAFGLDLAKVLAVEFAPAYRTSDYATTVLNTPVGARFINIWLPVSVVFKAGGLPVIAPYLGFGIAGNFQLDGTGYIGEWEDDVDDLANDAYAGFAVGTDIKASRFKIVPEFSFNYNLTADDPDTPGFHEQVYDIHIQVGFYYSP